MSSLADSFGNLLGRWVTLVVRWRRTTAVLTLVATLAAAFYASGNLGVNTDTANMISPTLPWRRDFIEFRDAFPIRDRNLLIVIDAASPQSADAFATALLTELRNKPELYHGVLMAGGASFSRATASFIFRCPRCNGWRIGSPPLSRCSECCRAASMVPPCSMWPRAR
jgi:hypothetical protein